MWSLWERENIDSWIDLVLPIGPDTLLAIGLLALPIALLKGRYGWASMPSLAILALVTQANGLMVCMPVFVCGGFGTAVVCWRLAKPDSLWARFFYSPNNDIGFAYFESIKRFEPERFEKGGMAEQLPEGMVMLPKGSVVRADMLPKGWVISDGGEVIKAGPNGADGKGPRKAGWTAFWTGEMFPDDAPANPRDTEALTSEHEDQKSEWLL